LRPDADRKTRCSDKQPWNRTVPCTMSYPECAFSVENTIAYSREKRDDGPLRRIRLRNSHVRGFELTRLAGVSAAGARRRNPEASEGSQLKDVVPGAGIEPARPFR